MKILYAPITVPNGLQLGTARALMGVGETQLINYRAWGTGAVSGEAGVWGRFRARVDSAIALRRGRKVFLQAVKNFCPDVVHMQIQQDPLVDPRLLQTIRQEFPGIILSHWTGDRRRTIPDNLLASARLCNTTFVSSYQYLLMFRAAGCNAYYLQHSYEPTEHYRRPTARDIPVVFLGNLAGTSDFPGEEVRRDVAQVVKRCGGDIYGRGWPDGLARGVANKFVGNGSIYARAKMAVNLNHFPEDMLYQSDRWFHAAACGAFTLSYYHPGIEYIIEDGKHTRYFRNARELEELIGYYLAHDSEREAIAAQGREHCLRHHNPASRAQELLRVWTCPLRGLEHWASPVLGEAEAQFVKSRAAGRILDMGACLRKTSLAAEPLYTNVDGNLSEARWRDSIVKTPFHGGILDTVTLAHVPGPHWHLALSEAARLASRTLIVFSAPEEMAVAGFSLRREGPHAVCTRREFPPLA